MRTVKYGVIGLGFFGEYHAQVAAALPNVELRALASRQDKRRKQLMQRFGVPRGHRDYHDLLADEEIEAVSVVTHVDDHAEPTIAALKAGKHVLVEKPMARTLADCDKMIAAARKHSRVSTVELPARCGKLFYRLLQQATQIGHTLYREIIQPQPIGVVESSAYLDHENHPCARCDKKYACPSSTDNADQHKSYFFPHKIIVDLIALP